MTQNKVILKIVVDFIVLACVSFPLLALSLWAEPYRRGYFEDDLSIRLPYKEQTISEAVCAAIGFAINVVTIIAIEVYRDKKGKGVGEKFLCGRVLPGWAWDAYVAIGVFTFGGACQQLTSNSAKYVIGRLRPHFYDVCRPVPTPGSALNQLGYIQDFTCSSSDQGRLQNMRLSFPSAHSSFIMYSAVFFILYLQERGKWRGSKLLRHGVQFAALMLAWYVGLSRIVDHMHHWSDVATGFAIGAVFGVLVFKCVLKPKKYGLPGGAWSEPAQPEMLPRPALR
ncbi:hypothetical protein JYU34_014666 [Plutella xylostella]|uniref:Phosphatidic acid phosphatase type 2/haloperoxidase domain-containing protein n=1 Tax=Plutella xylostella TaxID=51655 RepID=A0ABQ7Q8X9_PLUXY|nr:hypothetical protein JYU34_014666 [Plutella xylostella]